MARRAGVWVLGGAAAATGALLVAPDAYAWLRHKAGLATPEPEVEHALGEDAVDGTFDTRAARLSLRARLSETAEAEATAPAPAPAPASERSERPLAARPRPARTDVEPMRKAVDEARTRMLETARKATKENGPAA
jgi:hypothetical protein